MFKEQEVSIKVQDSNYKGTIFDRDVISLLVGVLYDDRQRNLLKERGVGDAIDILAEQAEGFRPAAAIKAKSEPPAKWPKIKGKPSIEAAIVKYTNAALVESILVKVSSSPEYTSRFTYLIYSIFPDIPPSICRPPSGETPGIWRANSTDTIGIIEAMLMTMLDGSAEDKKPSKNKKKAKKSPVQEAKAIEVEEIGLSDEKAAEVLSEEQTPDGDELIQATVKSSQEDVESFASRVADGEDADTVAQELGIPGAIAQKIADANTALQIMPKVVSFLSQGKSVEEIALLTEVSEEIVQEAVDTIEAMEAASNLDSDVVGQINELIEVQVSNKDIATTLELSPKVVQVVRKWGSEG